MIVYDDLEPSEKIKVYDKGITLNGNPRSQRRDRYQMLVGYRTGDMWAPQLDMTEALGIELRRVRRLHRQTAARRSRTATPACASSASSKRPPNRWPSAGASSTSNR